MEIHPVRPAAIADLTDAVRNNTTPILIPISLLYLRVEFAVLVIFMSEIDIAVLC
jgi:hypothetical protein